MRCPYHQPSPRCPLLRPSYLYLDAFAVVFAKDGVERDLGDDVFFRFILVERCSRQIEGQKEERYLSRRDFCIVISALPCRVRRLIILTSVLIE